MRLKMILICGLCKKHLWEAGEREIKREITIRTASSAANFGFFLSSIAAQN